MRRSPLRRSGFGTKLNAAIRQRQARQMTDYTPRPRPVAVAAAPLAMAAPVPKFAYVRDERLRAMCRAMACQHCGRGGPDSGVTWAHSNQAQHGKGGAIKASDVYVAAMCQTCHAALDQGGEWSEAEKVAIWTRAHFRTLAVAMTLGLWPAGIPIPYSTQQEAA